MDAAGVRAWLEQALANAAAGTEVPFATVDTRSGRTIGSSRFLSIAPEHRRLEIGWTWLGPAYQGSGANRAAKLLQLRHAFEDLGAIRVEFKTHAANDRSRQALLALGATFEGVFRRHMIMPDGSLRDSAYYSVIVEEWPALRDRLAAEVEARLAVESDAPVPGRSIGLPSSTAGAGTAPSGRS
jgi:RimJ/RimL family protein N-acetyltransferase